MYSVSDMITIIKTELGIYGLSLPIENADEFILKNIRLRTLRTFSTFFPNIIEMEIDLGRLRKISENYQESVYELPKEIAGREIMTIEKVDSNSRLLGGGYGEYLSPTLNPGMGTYEDLMMAQANANLLSTLTPPMTFKFVKPNILHLFNMATVYNSVRITFGLLHSDNFATIPQTSWESFLELAIVDTKKLLYNMLKHYNQIESAYGTVDLKIDDWSNAESDRKEIIERFKDSYHLDREQFYII